VADAPLTAGSALTIPEPQGVPFSNLPVAGFTDANPTAPVTDFTATINWGDGTLSNPDITPGTVVQPGGTGTAFQVVGSHAYLVAGTETGSVSIRDAGGQAITAAFTVNLVPSIFILNGSASGALTLSGNASIRVAGSVFVDSTSSSALSAGGNAQATAAGIQVVGGFQQSSTATLSPAPRTGIAPVTDPLASLASPSTAGLANHGPETLSGNAQATIPPGIYSQISVSGSARLTLQSGTYIIEGGGLTVTGGASISGTNVFIYNAGSNYPNSGGTFGGITLSGSGTFSLSAQATGTYAGIVIFQSRQDTRALSLSGNALAGLTGLIYAPSALLSLSGNSQLQDSLIVGMLNLSGNVSLTQIAAGSDGTGDGSGIANTLLAGNLTVSINDPSNLFTADELARIQDAINAWDAILAPYNITITEVSDPSLANLVIDTSTTTACGGVASGVLGCYNEASGEITMVQGWNWYAGSDPSQIGSGQYDFETTVLHELGHALGLGGSSNPNSPMYEILASGVTARMPTTQDLNIPDPPAGADPLTAAGAAERAAVGALPTAARSAAPAGLAAASGPATALAADRLGMPTPSPQQLAWSPAPTVVNVGSGSGHAPVVQGVDEDDERGPGVTRPRTDRVCDSWLDELASSLVRPRGPDPDRCERGPARPEPAVRAAWAGPGPARSRDRGLAAVPAGPMPRRAAPLPAERPAACATDFLLVAGFCGFGVGLRARKHRPPGFPAFP
jgi:hypothetical protein